MKVKKQMKQETFIVPESPMVNSYNMVKLLERAYKVFDNKFTKAMFPAFFDELPAYKYFALEKAFKTGKVKIEKPNINADCKITYEVEDR